MNESQERRLIMIILNVRVAKKPLEEEDKKFCQDMFNRYPRQCVKLEHDVLEKTTTGY